MNRILYSIVACCALAPALLGAVPGGAAGAVTCPNSNPIVNENNCTGAGTTAKELSNYSEDIGGFTTQTSYELGENVALKIGTDAPSFPGTVVNIGVSVIVFWGGGGV